MRLTDKQWDVILVTFLNTPSKMFTLEEQIRKCKKKIKIFDENDNLLYSADELYEMFCGEFVREQLQLKFKDMTDQELDDVIAMCQEIKESRQ